MWPPVSGRRSVLGPTLSRSAFPRPRLRESCDAGAVKVGDRQIDVLATPGHAAGHLCFRLTSSGAMAIFTGDLVFSRGRTAVLATPDTDLHLLASSVRAVAACSPDILLPGHCEPVLRGAVRHVETAAAAFDLAALPESLI